METEQKRAFIITITYTALVIALIFVVYKFLIIYLLPFIIGLALAYLLQKPSAYISDKTHIGKGTVSAVLVVVSFLLVIGAIFGGLFLLYLNADSVINYLQNTFNSVTSFLQKLSEKYESITEKMPQEMLQSLQNITNNLTQKFGTFLTDSVSRLASVVIKRLPGIAFSVTITVIASCYIAKDYEIVKDYILSLIPKKTKRIVLAVKRIVTVNLFKITKGYIILMLITFAELCVAFLIIGQQNPFRTALLISFIDLLPVLGTGAVLVPWGLVLILGGNYLNGVIIIAIYLVVMMVRNFLEPRIVGKQIGIPPIVSLILLFCGLKLFGFLGMVFSLLSLVVIVNLYKEKIIEL
ncbi:MAG: sporulation integral membrane protein YtvI [Clostridia bacterium]|nr:sporulation integral membrane protein YtvI [Clostridia bacterium]